MREVESSYDTPDERFQSGGRNCIDRAITWKSKEGKYRNSVESCVEFKCLTGSITSFGGQRENSSSK